MGGSCSRDGSRSSGTRSMRTAAGVNSFGHFGYHMSGCSSGRSSLYEKLHAASLSASTNDCGPGTTGRHRTVRASVLGSSPYPTEPARRQRTRIQHLVHNQTHAFPVFAGDHLIFENARIAARRFLQRVREETNRIV